jgi:hypothetical protein
MSAVAAAGRIYGCPGRLDESRTHLRLPEVGKIEEVGAFPQVAEQELGESVWLDVDSCECLGGEGDGLGLVVAAGGARAASTSALLDRAFLDGAA